MTAKTFEIIDRKGMIPALAILLKPETNADGFILHSLENAIALIRLDKFDMIGTKVPAQWYVLEKQYFSWIGENRTLQVAHKYIIDNWENLISGSVIDVEFVMGLTQKPRLTTKG